MNMLPRTATLFSALNLVIGVLVALLTLGSVTSFGGEAEHGGGGNKKEQEAPVVNPTEKTLSPAEQYCLSVRESAESAQISQERKNLAKAQRDVEERIKVLTAKTTEYQQWLKKRDDFLKQANDALVEIYSKIKPDAAAAQMMVMNEGVAAAIISKLPPKAAGLILSEMDAAHAVKLSSYLAGAGEITENHAQQSEGKN